MPGALSKIRSEFLELFRGFIRASLQNVEKYVLVTLCLHNYLRQTGNAGYCPAGFVYCEDSTERIKQGEWRSIVASGDAFVPYENRIIQDAATVRLICEKS